MEIAAAVDAWEGAEDLAYPAETPADPVCPGQTLLPVRPLLEGIALPSTWSRLRSPLARALGQLWQVRGLSERGRPARWVGLHSGRISINAHGWERMRASYAHEDPDPGLVGPAPRGWGAVAVRVEKLRVRWCRRRVEPRIRLAEHRADKALRDREQVDVGQLDTPAVARGPFDEWIWTELLIPWLEARLEAEPRSVHADRVGRALRVEQRFAAEIGRRLVDAGVLHKRGDVAYLTVEERIQAVIDHSPHWMRVIDARIRRVEGFSAFEIPAVFWGRPRVCTADTDGSAAAGVAHARRSGAGSGHGESDALTIRRAE